MICGALLLVLMVALVGCQPGEPPLPPVAPPAEDLSQWTVPEIVQPEPEEVRPVAIPDRPATPIEKVVAFAPAKDVDLQVQAGVTLDVIFGSGEQIRNYRARGAAECGKSPQGGDAPTESPWEVCEGADGHGESLRHHLFVTPAAPGLTLSLLVTTTVRTYYLTLKSVKTSPTRVVRWQYPAPLPAGAQARKEPGLLPDPETPKRYHVGYVLTSARQPVPDWMPRHVVDDGRKLYLVLPEITLFQTAPLVRMIGPNGPALVNARTFLNVTIVDQLAPRLELRVGTGESAEIVTITRGPLRTIECPGNPECPVWPAAAQALTRKGLL